MALQPDLASVPVQNVPLHKEISTALSAIAAVLEASLRPLPNGTGDGSYHTPPASTDLVQDLQTLDFKDVETVIEFVKEGITKEPVDDRTYLMEHVIKVWYFHGSSRRRC